MKIEVNLSKKYFFVILGVILLVGGLMLSYAYDSNFQGGNATMMGHSADEINININGQVMSLQQAFNSGFIGNVTTGATVDNHDIIWLNNASSKALTPANNVWTLYNATSLLGLTSTPKEIIIQQKWDTGQAPGSYSAFALCRNSGCMQYEANSISAGGSDDEEDNSFQGIFPVNTNGTFYYIGDRSDGGDHTATIVAYIN